MITLMKELYDVLILGAGASGLMCAAEICRATSLHVAIVEGNAKPAAKLKISGGGKCNITNVNVDALHFLGDERIVKHALDVFGKEELLDYFEKRGLKTVIRKRRYHFCPKSSDEVINILLQECKKADIFYGEAIVEVKKAKDAFAVKSKKRTYKAKKVVVATGAKSFPQLGATDIGLEIADSFGLEIEPFAPALAGLTLQPSQFWMKELTGISFYVRIAVDGKTVEEDMLFAHKGISGPSVLSASLYWKKGEVEINFLPDERTEALCKSSKKHISSAIPLPKRFVKAFLNHVGLSDKPCNKLSREEQQLLGTIHAYRFAPAGTFGFSKAEVCRGGVKTDTLDSKSMQSNLMKGLYFIGEVVDVTGELGGYNIQWAFSSAVVCAQHITKS